MRACSLVLSLSLVCVGLLSGCDGGPGPMPDAGSLDAEVVVVDAHVADASTCAPGQLGCPCDDGTCVAGACVSGTCTDCQIGSEGCTCRSDGTCSAGLRCDDSSGLCGTCPEGEEGCECGVGCGDGLVCQAGMCVVDTCTDGVLGCPCAASESPCEAGAFCDGTLCQACTADVAGCPCEGGACTGGLVCDSDLCRAALTCADVRGSGMCGAHERCDEAPGTDATCLTGTCEDDYRWSPETGTCVACVSEGCADEPSCAELDCGPHRLCMETDGVGDCADCEPGYTDVGGECVEVELCAGAICPSDRPYCNRTDPDNVECTAWPCGDPSIVMGSDGTCSVTCTRSDACAIPGSTGWYWPHAVGGACICETLPGYYFDLSGANRPVLCDADGDGWVRKEVGTLLDAASPDPALVANARCAIRQAEGVELVDEYGVTSVISSCEEGLIQDRTDEPCTVKPLRLFEIARNDVESEATAVGDGEAPPYAAGGRRFHAAELNSLTKACVTLRGDYDGDGIEDIAQAQPHPADTGPLSEDGRIRAFAHFVELYRTSWKPPAPGSDPDSAYGRIVITERSRCDALALGYGDDTAYDPDPEVGGPSYWRNCTRLRDPDFGTSTDSSVPGFDFAQWSCDATAGSCPAPTVPPNATYAAFPDPSDALLRDIGTCELGGSLPADGVWRGMGHHSQFQCVAVVPDGMATHPYDRERSSFDGDGSTLVFNACSLTDCAGTPGCTDSRAPSTPPDAYDPLLTCEHAIGRVPPDRAVGWAALRYQPYTNQVDYAGGCINEDVVYPDLCPSPDFGPCPTPGTNAFGRYHCYGWDSLFLWAGSPEEGEVHDRMATRRELEWAPDMGAAANMSIFYPATEDVPVCM